MVVESEEEEEKVRLLTESAAATPVRVRRGSAAVVRPSEESSTSSNLPRAGWQGGVSAPFLQLRPAEKTFLAMSGVLSNVRNGPTRPSCDNLAQVPDSIEVVRNILSELEADAEDRPETEEEEGDEDEVEVEEVEECTCLQVSTKSRVEGSLVVDVHQGAVHRCSKHTAERFPRCYSESHRQRGSREGGGTRASTRESLGARARESSGREETDQLHNLDNIDKIETVGEPGADRLRHFSESAVGVGGGKRRRATFSTELRQLRRSLTSAGRSQQLQEKEIDPEAASTELNSSAANFGSDVRFDIWDEQEVRGAAGEDASDFGEPESAVGEGDGEGEEDEFELPFEYSPHPLVTSLRTGIPPPPLTSLSHSSSTTSMPICRICQLPSVEPSNPLISPCRCLGSIRFVHNPCLMKWLEVSSKKNSEPPGCELCQYQYIRHKKFVISNWLLPSCSSKDKVLHSVFMAAIGIMITCSIVTILCFKQNGEVQPRVGPNTELSASELMTLSCGVLFFLAFFVAMYVEVKAENTIYQLICKFFYMNHEWTIEEYDRRRDPAKQLDSP